MEGHTEPMPDHHFTAGWSSFFMDGVATIGFLAVAVLALWRSHRNRRAAAQATATFTPDAKLKLGETAVMGFVEWEQDARVAVRVEVEQKGTEAESSGSWTYRWAEIHRTIRVHPFYLRHSSGVRIRVKPNDQVKLLDPMDGVIRVNLNKRVLVAELMPDEKVCAVGELQRAPDPEAQAQGYRETATGYVLVPPRGRSMLLSSEPPAKRFLERAALHRRWAIITVIAALAFHYAFGSFHTRRWLGRTVEGHVTQLLPKESDSESELEVRISGADGFRWTSVVFQRDYRSLKEGDKIQVRYVPSSESDSVIGPGVTVSIVAALSVPLLFILVIVYSYRALMQRPWYEHKRLFEAGNGRLKDSKPIFKKHANALEEIAASIPEEGAGAAPPSGEHDTKDPEDLSSSSRVL